MLLEYLENCANLKSIGFLFDTCTLIFRNTVVNSLFAKVVATSLLMCFCHEVTVL